MAMFRATVAGEAARRSPFARRAKVIVVAASLGATAMTGAAAAAGRLPPDIQDMASQLLDRVGIHVPAANRTGAPIDVPTELPIAGRGRRVEPRGSSLRRRRADRWTLESASADPDRRLGSFGRRCRHLRRPGDLGRDDGRLLPAGRRVRAATRRTIPVTAQDAGAAPSPAVPAAQATTAASPGGPSDAAAAPTAPAAPVEEPAPAADHGQQGPPSATPDGPPATAPGRGHGDPPAGPPADVPANSHASPAAGPPADVPANSHASPPAGPPADVPANSPRVAASRSGDRRSVRGREIAALDTPMTPNTRMS